MKNMLWLIRSTRLAMLELGPEMGVFFLPGGYVIALTGWLHRLWPQHPRRS